MKRITKLNDNEYIEREVPQLETTPGVIAYAIIGVTILVKFAEIFSKWI